MSSSSSSSEETKKPTVDKEIVIETQPQQQQQDDTITILKSQYQNLLQANMQSLSNTLNSLDTLDRIIASLVNVQTFVMNLKDSVKQTQLGIGNNNTNPTTPTNNSNIQQRQEKS